MWRVTFCGFIALFLTLWLNRANAPSQLDTDIRSTIERTGSFLTAYQGENGQARSEVRTILQGCTLNIEVYSIPSARVRQKLLYADILKLEDVILPARPLQTQSFDFATRKAQTSWTVIYKAKPNRHFLRKKADGLGQAVSQVPLTRSAVSYRGPRHKRPELENWLNAIKVFQDGQCKQKNE